MAEKTIRIQLVRGLAGKRRDQLEAIRGLGLRRTRQIVERPDTPAVRGQIKKVAHLVAVLEES